MGKNTVTIRKACGGAAYGKGYALFRGHHSVDEVETMNRYARDAAGMKGVDADKLNASAARGFTLMIAACVAVDYASRNGLEVTPFVARAEKAARPTFNLFTAQSEVLKESRAAMNAQIRAAEVLKVELDLDGTRLRTARTAAVTFRSEHADERDERVRRAKAYRAAKAAFFAASDYRRAKRKADRAAAVVKNCRKALDEMSARCEHGLADLTRAKDGVYEFRKGEGENL